MSEFASLVLRSRSHMAQDAFGVAVLFAMLFGALHLAAI